MKFTHDIERQRKQDAAVCNAVQVTGELIGGRVHVGEAPSPERNAVSASEAQAPKRATVDELLAQAVQLALQTEKPKAVTEWLRRAADSVERGEYEA
jgi:hypothetical protein